MKILELTLKNFLPILAGIGKEEIHLNLRDSTNLISVFIGKIGSGKTYILSHLQPFSTVGTLDVRNSDDPIIEGKDGKKVIVYEKDNHEYIITHDYHWTGKTHTKKSYIEKDGVELNENGNSSSFKDIIQLEFGIDQSFLRLLRLGPNVVNFINMKATERKAYIASLLSDTELYLALYKAWSVDLRTLNTKANILMNKMNSFSKKSVNELKDDLESLEDQKFDLNTKLNDITQKKFQLQAENKSYMKDLTYSGMKELESTLLSRIASDKALLEVIHTKLDAFKQYPELVEVSKIIGKLDNTLDTIGKDLHDANTEYEEVTANLHKLLDRKAISSNEDHLQTLQATYDELLQQDKQYQYQLQGFKCSYSSTFLSGFLGDLNLINVLINEIVQYDRDAIRTVFNSDSSIISFSKKKIEILGYTKLKVEKTIQSLKFADRYEPPSKLYFPPFCPTKSCPYYVTHPYTIQKETENDNSIQNEIMKYQHELRDLDTEITKYNDYPIIYAKISSLKEYWKKAKPILEEIHAMNVNDLKRILLESQYQVWYNYDKIVNTIDLLEKREKYYELTEKIKEIKTEITALSISELNDINKEIDRLQQSKVKLEKHIEEKEIERKDTEDDLKTYNQMYLDLSEKTNLEKESHDLTSQIDSDTKQLSELQENYQKIKDNVEIIQKYDMIINELNVKMKDSSEKMDRIKTILNDIKYTNKELESVLEEQKYMNYMVDAASSKKGIPLIMIQIFLDSCRDTLNEMLYAVCEDDIEILPFKINDTEFKIPYMVNGQVIDDISKASQGQSSIVSTCMSFALVKQTGSVEYNIPLLDEMDGPLHKNDKQKFIAILLKYLKEIGSEQCFVITHDDNTFDGYPVQVIMTTDENVNREKYSNVIKL